MRSSPSSSSRIPVITGMGVMCALGENTKDAWNHLIQGESAAAPVLLFDVSTCRCKIAASVQVPEKHQFRERKGSRTSWSRTSRLLLPAAQAALEQAHLLDPQGN